jgi:acyl-coenzyme A thioesterase PaaI-like protein
VRPRQPGAAAVTATVRTQGEHLTVCEADVEREGGALVHPVATFAVLHR